MHAALNDYRSIHLVLNSTKNFEMKALAESSVILLVSQDHGLTQKGVDKLVSNFSEFRCANHAPLVEPGGGCYYGYPSYPAVSNPNNAFVYGVMVSASDCS